ncbi:MAG: four helix bundle protein [Bacteroidaceae bacterium]|nr:four helix bundle protein [Bacteroidaceae bacterium]
MIERFEDLNIFKDARELCRVVYEITRNNEFERDLRFAQQIRAAAGSIMDNIAEGFERSGNKEFKQFLFIAKGSCGEVRSQIIRALDCHYIDQNQLNSIYNQCVHLSVGISNMITSLNKSEYKGTKYNKNNYGTGEAHETTI